MQKTEQKFTDGIEVVDGNEYNQCTFDRCTVIYRGGPLPSIVNCTFNACKWQFDDAAERTLLFMHLLYHGMGDAGAKLIDSTMEDIRRPPVNA